MPSTQDLLGSRIDRKWRQANEVCGLIAGELPEDAAPLLGEFLDLFQDIALLEYRRGILDRRAGADLQSGQEG